MVLNSLDLHSRPAHAATSCARARMHASPREASRMAQAASAAEACWLQPSRAIAPATARSRVSVRDARRGRGGWTWLGAGGLEARAAAAGVV